MIFSKPPRVEISSGDPLEARVNSIIVPVRKSGEKPLLEGVAARADKLAGGVLSGAIESGDFKADVGEIVKGYHDGRIILFVGLGGDAGKPRLLENLRAAYARAVSFLLDKAESAVVIVEPTEGVEAREAVVGALLGAYKFDYFKTDKSKKRRLSLIYFTVAESVLREALALAEGVYLARDLANAPPHEVAPSKLARLVRDLFSSLENVEVEVLDYERLVEEGFGGIVAVGKGSKEKPVLIIVRYKGSGGEPVALVGKTMVFDSGGINLKPSQSMFDMRADKAGGAAVLGVTWAAARAGLKVNIVALLPAAINVPSGESYLPSDVIRMKDGTTVEVTNTDAEGRLTLADAIAYAAKDLNAREVIDVATLTGAAAVALGPFIAAVFTRSQDLLEEVKKASEVTGEKVWQLPLEDDYKPALEKKAPLADLANAAMRYGGAICAALFLEHFNHGKPHIHLDIAGPGIGLGGEAVKPPAYWPQGLAPGWGARLLYEYLKGKAGE
ncbi:leucyl aminopeptidase [Stetteria hydrogenophila]